MTREGTKLAEQVFMQDVAEQAGISVETIRMHRRNSDLARVRGTDTTADFPPVAGHSGIRPYWTPEQVQTWLENRRAPQRPGGIKKQAMRDVLAAAQDGNINRVIKIAKDALK